MLAPVARAGGGPRAGARGVRGLGNGAGRQDAQQGEHERCEPDGQQVERREPGSTLEIPPGDPPDHVSADSDDAPGPGEPHEHGDEIDAQVPATVRERRADDEPERERDRCQQDPRQQRLQGAAAPHAGPKSMLKLLWATSAGPASEIVQPGPVASTTSGEGPDRLLWPAGQSALSVSVVAPLRWR